MERPVNVTLAASLKAIIMRQVYFPRSNATLASVLFPPGIVPFEPRASGKPPTTLLEGPYFTGRPDAYLSTRPPAKKQKKSQPPIPVNALSTPVAVNTGAPHIPFLHQGPPSRMQKSVARESPPASRRQNRPRSLSTPPHKPTDFLPHT